MANPVMGVSHWDDVEPVASEEAVGFPAINLTRNGKSHRWETENVAGIKSILWSATDRRIVSLVHLAHHNGSDRGTFRLRFANDDVGEIQTNPVVDTAPFGPAWWADHDGLSGSGSASNGAWTSASFSLECWLFPEHDGAQGILRRAGGTDRPTISINTGGKVIFSDTPNATHTLTSTTSVVAGEWIHIAAAYNSGTNTAKLIINGVEEATLGSVTAWDVGTQIEVSPIVAESMSGKINEIRFWNFARSAAQVAADFQSMLVGNESGLLGVWGSEAPTNGMLNNRVAGGADLTVTPAQFSYGPPNYPGNLWATPDLYHRTWRDAFFHEPLGIACQFLQVDLLDNTNTDGRLRMARVVISEALQMTKQFTEGSDFASGSDHSQIERSLLGFESAFPQETKTDFTKQWASWEKWEAEWLWNIYQSAGTTRDVSALADPQAETVGDLGLGLYRFPATFRIRFDHRMSRESGVWQANLQLRGI